MKCVSDASGVIPQIAIIDGVCGGSSAVVASMFDLVITVKDKSKLFVNAPFNVGQQSATAMGYSAYEAENGEDAYRFARELVLTLPENNTALAYVDTADDPCRATDVDLKSCDAATAVSTLADDGRFITLFEGYAENVKVGLASFGGILCGVVASDKKNGGALDVKSARVASKLLSFCDSFGIPVLTLVDSVGIEVSSEAEASSYASELARLAYAYTSSDNAKVSVVMGKAYGAAFTLLGSKSVGADIALALPDAKVSVLSPEASVAFLWNDKVGDKSREELEAEWSEKCASAKNACDLGEIDYIVEPCELRARICAAFSMLCAKAEGTPTRKHVNMPL